MGQLYQITKKIVPEIKNAAPIEFPSIFAQLDRLQGLHPTTLVELLEKLAILKTRGIETEKIEVSPVLEEGRLATLYEEATSSLNHIHLPSVPVSVDTHLYLRYTAALSSGRVIPVEDRIKCNIAFRDGTRYDNSFFTHDVLRDAERGLTQLAQQHASALRELGYNAVVGYTIQRDKGTVGKMIADFFGA